MTFANRKFISFTNEGGMLTKGEIYSSTPTGELIYDNGFTGGQYKTFEEYKLASFGFKLVPILNRVAKNGEKIVIVDVIDKRYNPQKVSVSDIISLDGLNYVNNDETEMGFVWGVGAFPVEEKSKYTAIIYYVVDEGQDDCVPSATKYYLCKESYREGIFLTKGKVYIYDNQEFTFDDGLKYKGDITKPIAGKALIKYLIPLIEERGNEYEIG